MNTLFFSAEADQCRSLAKQFEGKPERQFLLSLARGFDQLETATVHSINGRGTRPPLS